MIDTSIELRGWIARAAVIEPLAATWLDDYEKYGLEVYPESPHEYDEIEQRIDMLKYMNPIQLDNPDVVERYTRKDSVIKGKAICFESLHRPKLSKELKELGRDEALIGHHVAVTGNIQIHKDGNVYLSAHLITAIPDPSPELFEEIEDDGF